MARDPNLPEYSYARRRGRPALDPAMRRIAIGAGVVSAAVIIVALLWSGLKPGLGLGGAVPEIAAPTTPLRVVPANPGGLTVPGANEQIMSGQTSDAAPQLAQPPPPAELGQLQQAANAPPQPPAAVAAKPPPPAPAPPPAAIPAPATPPTALAGPARVQLAATSTEAAAHALWVGLQHKIPDLLAGKTPIFIEATVAGKTVWRLRINGFADAPAAQTFCRALLAKGAPCVVAAF